MTIALLWLLFPFLVPTPSRPVEWHISVPYNFTRCGDADLMICPRRIKDVGKETK